MKEVLYEIPVNDIFDKPCECVICSMKKNLDDDEIAFAMGPSYMEDDIRLTTDEIGFCSHHIQLMYEFENRLGLALILNTHIKNIIQKIEPLQTKGRIPRGMFRKKASSPLFEYTSKQAHSCFICNRLKEVFERYLITIFYLYEKDSNFRKKFKNCNGFCLEHYGILFEMAPSYLHGTILDDFTATLNEVFLRNLKRIEEEVSWFVDKFDYRNKEKPWGTSKDVLPRALTKINSIIQKEK